MATKVYKGLFLICFIVGLWQLQIDYESAYIHSSYQHPKKNSSFSLGHTLLIAEEKRRWLNQISLFKLQTRHVLLCSHSIGEGKSLKQGGVIDLEKSDSKESHCNSHGSRSGFITLT